MECIVVLRARKTRIEKINEYSLFYRDPIPMQVEEEKIEKYTIPYEPLDAEEEMKLFRNCLKAITKTISQLNRETIRFMSE